MAAVLPDDFGNVDSISSKVKYYRNTRMAKKLFRPVVTPSESNVFDQITGPAMFINKAFGFSITENRSVCRNLILLLIDFHLNCFMVSLIFKSTDQIQSLDWLKTWNDLFEIFCAVFTRHYFCFHAEKIYDWRSKLINLEVLVDYRDVKKSRNLVILIFLLLISANILEITILMYDKFERNSDINETLTVPFITSQLNFFLDNFITSPINDFYLVLYYSICLVCSVYMRSYGRFIERLRRPSTEEWQNLQTLRIDLTSAIKDINDVVSPLFFLWTLQLASYIPAVLNSWINYSGNVLLKISFSSFIIRNVLEVVIISFSAAKVYQESQNCIANIAELDQDSDNQEGLLLTTILYIYPPQMTAWNFFGITKGVILTVAGGIFTCTVLIYQLRSMEDK